MIAERRADRSEPIEALPLPPGLDLLWGRRDRGRRGPEPRAVGRRHRRRRRPKLADAEGLEAVSMARVAKELGFTTMSLYRYVSSKDELLQLMWNASAQGAERPRARWRRVAVPAAHWAQIQREMLDRHPWITQMPMAAPPLAPNSLTFVERGLEALDGTGLADADKLRVIGLHQLLHPERGPDGPRRGPRGRAAERDTKAGGRQAKAPPPWSFEALLRELVDEERYPRLHRIAWSADIGDNPSGFDERQEFLFGVERILDGVQALIDRS